MYTELKDKLKDLNVLLIGETIIDQYVYVRAKGRATKDPILSTGFISEEKFLGGVLAPARHLANFVKNVTVITLLGDINTEKEYIEEHLPGNINIDFFIKINSPTIVKKRYIEPVHFQKLFKMEIINDQEINEDLSDKIIKHIEEIKDSYDIILINDFGHGMFSAKLINYICNLEKFIGLNVQTNSSNYGYNPVTKFKKANFLSMNETELQLPFHSKKDTFYDFLCELKKKNDFGDLLLTLGKQGCIFYRDKFYASKARINKPIDTIGAGDAVFCFSALLSFLGFEGKFIADFANVIGAIAVENIGNKESIKPLDIAKFCELRK